MRKYYKVVNKERSGALISIYVDGKAKVEYKIGEFVEAPDWLAKEGYHLLVFDNLKDALTFYEEDVSLQLFECECKDEVELKEYLSTSFLEIGCLRSLTIIFGWPEGTRMFKRVKLIKRVR